MKVFKIEMYATRQDAINALRVLRKHIKANDFNAAKYMMDRLFGTPASNKPEGNDVTEKGIQVVIMLPPKYSELGKSIEISHEEVPKMEQKTGKTLALPSKPTRNDGIGTGKRGK